MFVYLYHLKLPDSRIDWDCAIEYVVAAGTEKHARAIAASTPGDEGVGVWLAEASCVRVGTAAACVLPGTVIVRSFRAG